MIFARNDFSREFPDRSERGFGRSRIRACPLRARHQAGERLQHRSSQLRLDARFRRGRVRRDAGTDQYIISMDFNVDGDGQSRYIIRFGTQFDMFVRSQSNIRLNTVLKFNLPITGEIVKVVYSSNFELKLCCQVVCLLTQGFDDVRQGRKGAASFSVDAPGRRLPGIHVQPVHGR